MIKVYIPRAIGKVGDSILCDSDLPLNVILAIMSAVYRGDMGPKTAQLIKDEDWCKVAAEYLDHEGYRNCVANGLSGIKIRMDWNAAQFQSMCDEDEGNISIV